MPAPIHADWPAVRDTAVALQSIKRAAIQHGVPYKAAKMRASREAWPLGRRLSKALAAAKQAHAQAVHVANPKAVACVTSTSDALVNELSEDNRETKLSLSHGIRRAAQFIEKASAPLLFTGADRVKQIVSAAATVHGWDADKASAGPTLNLLQIQGDMNISR